MKLFEIAGPTTLYHLTSIHNATSIIKSGIFKLAHVPNSKPRMYVMSTATDQASDFFGMMSGPGTVVMYLNRRVLEKSRVRIAPYKCPDAEAEFGPEFDEMEEQLRSSSPTIKIPTPLNKTIYKIVVRVGKTDPTGTNHYNENQLREFLNLCARASIPTEIVQFQLGNSHLFDDGD